jgi:hypothetical protein
MGDMWRKGGRRREKLTGDNKEEWTKRVEELGGRTGKEREEEKIEIGMKGQ